MKSVSEGVVGAELFHKTEHEVCLSIGGQMFIFHDSINKREYDLGDRIWDAINKHLRAVDKWEKYPAPQGGVQ